MSLLSAIVQSSRAYATPIAKAYASGNRPFTVVVRRPGDAEPVYDRTTHQMVNPLDPVLYRGPGRIHVSSPDHEIEIGEERTAFTSTVISIDTFSQDTSANLTLAPQSGDTVTVIDDEESRAAHLAGRVFEVTGVERGGHFDVGWRLDVTGAMPGRRG